jgi:hypothetical protein
MGDCSFKIYEIQKIAELFGNDWETGEMVGEIYEYS